jgi:restriction system protein
MRPNRMNRDVFGTLRTRAQAKEFSSRPLVTGRSASTSPGNKPIELIAGSNVLYLLAEYRGIDAKIIPPDDWKDPVADTPEQDSTTAVTPQR